MKSPQETHYPNPVADPSLLPNLCMVYPTSCCCFTFSVYGCQVGGAEKHSVVPVTGVLLEHISNSREFLSLRYNTIIRICHVLWMATNSKSASFSPRNETTGMKPLGSLVFALESNHGLGFLNLSVRESAIGHGHEEFVPF